MNEEQKQIAFYVVVAIVLLAILWFVTSKISDAIAAIAAIFEPQGPTQAIDPETDPIETDAARLSFPAVQYDSWADSIYESFNYLGSNWTPVLAIFQELRTNDDVYALINAYGVRTLFVFGIGTAPLNLPQAMVREATFWNGPQDVNDILAAKGITYRF